MPHALIFLMGAAAVVVVKALGAGTSAVLRPVMKGVVKGGIKIGRSFQEMASEVSEELQDVTAEAKAELADKPVKQTKKGPQA